MRRMLCSDRRFQPDIAFSSSKTTSAQVLADALEVVGYDTRVAFDGPTALALAARFQPDAALWTSACR